MACPTCDDVQRCVGPLMLWCPRCGTWVDESPSCPTVLKPALVNRCREFQKTMNDEQMDVWDFYDIPDCLNLPENRS